MNTEAQVIRDKEIAEHEAFRSALEGGEMGLRICRRFLKELTNFHDPEFYPDIVSILKKWERKHSRKEHRTRFGAVLAWIRGN